MSAVQVASLHSLPGSRHTLFLDLDGGLVAGTVWNAELGLPEAVHPGWDVDPATVLSLWRRVAEDFSPLDVDVTTEDPGVDALARSSPEDEEYGVRVAVTDSHEVSRAVCPTYCSGLAWLGVFDAPDGGVHQPVWVFPHALAHDPKLVADTVSHEVGHTLGLLHDGTEDDSYYGGRGSWAPIMGDGSDRPVVQWSAGDYPGATNTQDDLAVMAAHGVGLRPDEAPGSVDGAGPPPAGRAYVGADADRDVWDLGTCEGAVTVRARRTRTSPNLDLSLTVLDAAGAVVAYADPPARRLDYDHATGLSARLDLALPAGRYLAAVEGVGAGDTYSAYGSVGGYRLRVSGC